MEIILIILVVAIIAAIVGLLFFKKKQQASNRTPHKPDQIAQAATTTPPAPKKAAADTPEATPTQNILQKADGYIFDQRYDDAIQELKRIVIMQPSNQDAMLKLLQVYALDNRQDAFTALHQKIHNIGRPDIIEKADFFKSMLEPMPRTATPQSVPSASASTPASSKTPEPDSSLDGGLDFEISTQDTPSDNISLDSDGDASLDFDDDASLDFDAPKENITTAQDDTKNEFSLDEFLLDDASDDTEFVDNADDDALSFDDLDDELDFNDVLDAQTQSKDDHQDDAFDLLDDELNLDDAPAAKSTDQDDTDEFLLDDVLDADLYDSASTQESDKLDDDSELVLELDDLGDASDALEPFDDVVEEDFSFDLDDTFSVDADKNESSDDFLDDADDSNFETDTLDDGKDASNDEVINISDSSTDDDFDFDTSLDELSNVTEDGNTTVAKSEDALTNDAPKTAADELDALMLEKDGFDGSVLDAEIKGDAHDATDHKEDDILFSDDADLDALFQEQEPMPASAPIANITSTQEADDSDNLEVTLNLAQRYLDLGESDSAKRLLLEVQNYGNDAQKQQASQYLDKL